MRDPKQPPENARDVLVRLTSGMTVRGYWWRLTGQWFVVTNGRPRAVTVQGWDEMSAVSREVHDD